MILTCSLCSHELKTLTIGDNDRALNELSQALAVHLKERHNNIALQMGKDLVTLTGIIPWLLLMKYAIFGSKDLTTDKTSIDPFIKSQWEMWAEKYFECLGIPVVKPKKETE